MKHLLTVIFLSCAPMTLLAQDQTPKDQILSQLSAQGFKVEAMSRTLLGRVRVVSTDGRLERETVFNPRTGYVLRDIWRTVSGRDDHDNEVAELLSPPGEPGNGENTGSGEQEYEDDGGYDDNGSDAEDDAQDEEDEADESDDDSGDSEDSEDSEDEADSE